MALPSRPNARVGLPTNPRSRSAIATPPRTPLRADYPPRPSSAAGDRPRVRTTSSPLNPPRPLRPQRSMVDLTSTASSASRARSVVDRSKSRLLPPVPPLPNTKTKDLSKQHPARKASASSIDTSSSSSSSSYYASSSTSLDDNSAEAQMKNGSQKPLPGFGSSLWSRVASAAGNISVSVSKAWEANIAVMSGEITPPGQESRLTRAMKAYHIANAQSPADLPEWLFDERERGVRSRVLTEVSREADAPPEPQKTEQAQPFRVRDIVVPTKSNGVRPGGRVTVPDDAVAPMSRAAQRLKEMAEAKRNPKVSKIQFVETPHPRRAEVKGQGSAVRVEQSMPNAKGGGKIPQLPRADVRAKQSSRGLPSGVRPLRT